MLVDNTIRDVAKNPFYRYGEFVRMVVECSLEGAPLQPHAV